MEFLGANATQILVTFISTLGAVACAVVGRKDEPKKAARPLNAWAVGMWACVVIAAANTGFLGWRLMRPGPAPAAAITYPSDQGRVEQTETVRGTSQGLSARQVVWVVVCPQDVRRYYPMSRSAVTEADNNWSSIAYLGLPANAGKRFEVLAVLTDAAAQDAFNGYFANASGRSDWPGLEALPTGAVIYDRITVTRR